MDAAIAKRKKGTLRSFCSSAFFLTALYVLVHLFRSIVDLLFGTQLYGLESYPRFLVSEAALALIWALALVRYFYLKRYWTAFWATAVYSFAAFLQLLSFLKVARTWEATDFLVVSTFVVMVANIVVGIALIFSKASQRRLLWLAGILLCSVGFLWLFIAVLALGPFPNGFIQQQVSPWLSFASVLILVLFLVNFRMEKDLLQKVRVFREDGFTVMVVVVTVFGLVGSIVFGLNVAMDGLLLSRDPAAHLGSYQKEVASPFEARTYQNSAGETLPYRLLKPRDYDPSRKYPLVVCLHGSGGRGLDNVKQVAGTQLGRMLSTKENRARYPAFIYVPQCPPKLQWGGISDIPSVDLLVVETIQALEEEFSIDANRRYISGVSMGGYGAWHLISTQPDVFAGAIPIAGGGNPDFAATVVDVPIWAFHGAKDRNVPVKGSRAMIEAIREEGGQPKYTEYADARHHIGRQVEATPDLLDWLFTQRRTDEE